MRYGVLFVLGMLLVLDANAASFDCKQASMPIERTICGDSVLSDLDDNVSKIYFKLYGAIGPAEKKALKQDQRAWLKSRTQTCAAIDAKCLVEVYRRRYFELRKQDMQLIPYKPTTGKDFQGIRGQCDFRSIGIPQDTRIYAGGGYKGKRADFQIDDSGHQATQFDVAVNEPGKDVALLLGAYEPSVWNIGWEENTNIVAVYVTGYHRQKVIGLPEQTPLIISSDRGAACGRMYVAAKNIDKLNPLSQRVYGKNITMVTYASNGKIVFGGPVNKRTPMVSSGDSTLADVIDKDKPKAGKAGLTEAIRQGVLRPARKSDYARWAQKMAKQEENNLPPVAGADARESFYPRHLHNPYVVLKDFTIPAGLYGAHSAQFFVLEGVPFPKGNPGHSDIYDFNTMTCKGVSPSCRGMR